MNKFLLLISVLLVVVKLVNAQEGIQQCGTGVLSQQWENEFQKFISNYKSNRQDKRTSSMTHSVPVIFHIIHGGESVGTFPNLSQGQINSQITVLNQDFSGTGFNVGNYPAAAFTNWANNQVLPAANIDNKGRVKIADMGIRFCLASVDAHGNTLAEPGIERIDFNSKGWINTNTFTTTASLSTYINETVKPQSIWDVTKYLNIWVSDKNSMITFTGFSSMPPLSTMAGIGSVGTDTTDGVWCYTKALGSNTLYPTGIYAAPQVQGRTITHEVGHYFGLRHIWGDGACATDYCNDTPPAANQNTGASTYPHNVGSCSSLGNSPDGEMFMNFMDYSADPNKYMFTTDQAIRAQTAISNSPYRNLLGTHNLCTSSTTSIVDMKSAFPIFIYPNPTKGIVNISFLSHKIQSIKIYNLTGELVQEFIETEFTISHLPCGLYFVIVQSENEFFIKKLIKE